MDATQQLLQNGLSGIVILALAGTVVKLYLANQRLHEQRLNDSRENTLALMTLNDRIHAVVEQLAKKRTNGTSTPQSPSSES